MRIVVLGAGVVGVTTAYELSRNPANEVIVVDSADNAASEASAANAAMIAPGHAYAWASSKVPKILFKSLYRNDQAFRIRFRVDREFWRWTVKFLKQCNDRDAVRNSLRKHTLCLYSQQRLHQIVHENKFKFDRVSKGLLYLFRNSNTFHAGVEHSSLLSNNGQQMEQLTASEVIDHEPAFREAKGKIAGAIFCPTDETGNSKKFTQALADICQTRGVSFQFNTKAVKFIANQHRISEVVTTKGNLEADLFVVSLGAQTPLLLKPVGIDLPIYPVKGYSLTLPVNNKHTNLTVGTVDEDNLVAIAPIGENLRVTATAEFAGYDARHTPKDFKSMFRAVKDLLPNAADYSNPTYTTCFRPMTPQGTPYIGYSKFDNLFINSGQGHMGWTMACGSARIASDMIEERVPDIDQLPFDPRGY